MKRQYLIQWRKDRCINQKEVAVALNIPQNTYCQIEIGARQPDLRLSTILKLADFFKVAPEEIIHEEKKLMKGDE